MIQCLGSSLDEEKVMWMPLIFIIPDIYKQNIFTNKKIIWNKYWQQQTVYTTVFFKLGMSKIAKQLKL